MRVLVIRLIGVLFASLVVTEVWLITAFLLSNEYPPLNRAAFIPGQWIVDHLPRGSAAFVYGRESQGAHHTFLALMSVLFWWCVFATAGWIILGIVRRVLRAP
jgi:hypothetical protein